MMLRRSAGKAVLVGHVARANSHWRQFDGGAEILAIFHGPHAYVSPSWYATSPAVPTWNYSAVHVYGKPLAREDVDFAASVLRDLVARYEGTRAKPWRMEDLAADFYEKLAGAIVAFEMPIDRSKESSSSDRTALGTTALGCSRDSMRKDLPRPTHFPNSSEQPWSTGPSNLHVSPSGKPITTEGSEMALDRDVVAQRSTTPVERGSIGYGN